MSKLRNVIIVIIIIFGFWYFYGDALKSAGIHGVAREFRSDLHYIQTHPQINRVVNFIKTEIKQLLDTKDSEPSEPTIEKPDLMNPTEQTFSIYNFEIGDVRSDVESIVGKPKRMSMNEYGVEWATYHENYFNFLMVAYNEQDQVVGLYTNQDLISSKVDISYGTEKELVHALEHDPLEFIRKGWVSYRINSEGEYDLFLIDENYVTVFYDTQKGDVVTAILIINSDLEDRKEDIYGEPSDELKVGFEYQLFDLTNAARVTNGLSILEWDEAVRETARSHSTDMAQNEYFSHTNLAGQSPFDRLAEDDIVYRMAGENIAMGQFSSIFAHEGLMNSPGHRENILLPEFEALGIGVDFNDKGQPFFTQKFLSY